MSDILALQQQLATLLHPYIDGDTMRVDEVQGFMCAVLSGPDDIQLEDWMPEILGDENLFSDAQKAQILELIRQLSDAWAAQLEARELTLLLEDDEDGELDYQTWANAYLFALDVVNTDWFEAANDEEFEDAFYPMMVTAGIYDEEGIDISPKERKESAEQLAATAEQFFHYWKAVQNKPQTIFRGEKVGRNDPCPCNSGKKYKACCAKEV
ncbi:YecA family protein [Vitreoscilla sp. C1]|uniref:UPF0149 family protein n=1 Tax=Vitreoscilla sp. (strain C1) TaxID=96942 RepID=UPI000CDC3904|nr:UPF0149 family protein [Vitreoscilla sp. C1]AUZ04582.1 YecA family protein [Vitreoscilla sp. C1]